MLLAEMCQLSRLIACAMATEYNPASLKQPIIAEGVRVVVTVDTWHARIRGSWKPRAASASNSSSPTTIFLRSRCTRHVFVRG